MAFNQSTFAPLSAQSSSAPRVWTYSTPDDLSTVTSTGYFDDKKFQLQEFDFILAVVDGVLIKLVIGSDTSSATPSNTVTYASFYQGVDSGSYSITSGSPTEIGLEVTVPVGDSSQEDYQVRVALPSIAGSNGSTDIAMDINVGNIVATSITRKIGNSELGINASFFIERGTFTGTGDIVVKALIANVSGDVTVNSAAGSSISIIKNQDVQI